MAADLEALFDSFRTEIESEQGIRDGLREITRQLERQGREMLALLQKAHQSRQASDEACAKARRMLPDVCQLYQRLADAVPADEYFKYHDGYFRFVNQRFAFLVALLVYLEKAEVASRRLVADTLGIAAEKSAARFFLDLDDYLHGLLQLCNELARAPLPSARGDGRLQSRFALNCVSAGDYERPIDIARFVGELDGGFRLLNFKNDALRKRLDVLKYDVQRVEQIVYDLSIRHLRPAQPAAAAAAAAD